MAKSKIACVDASDEADDRQVCETCGEPMSDQEIFAAQMAAIYSVLDEMEPWDQAEVIRILAGEHIGTLVVPHARRKIRDSIIAGMDKIAGGILAEQKAERKNQTMLRRLGKTSLAHLPDAPTTRQ